MDRRTRGLGGYANTLISEFDENAWLDLLRDDSLRYYADQCWENDDGHRLDEVSAERKRRGETYTVGDPAYDYRGRWAASSQAGSERRWFRCTASEGPHVVKPTTTMEKQSDDWDVDVDEGP